MEGLRLREEAQVQEAKPGFQLRCLCPQHTFLPLAPWYRHASFYCVLLSCSSKILRFSKNWSFLATLGWANLLVQFFQEHLLTSFLYLYFGYSHDSLNFFVIIILVKVICDQWSLTLLLCLWLIEDSNDG